MAQYLKCQSFSSFLVVLWGNLFEFLDYYLSDIHDQFIFVYSTQVLQLIIQAKIFQNWERSLHSIEEIILERETDKEKHITDPLFSTVDE